MGSEPERCNAVNNRQLPAQSSPHIAVEIQSSMIRDPHPALLQHARPESDVDL